MLRGLIFRMESKQIMLVHMKWFALPHPNLAWVLASLLICKDQKFG
jgi:hypothetical protein